MQQSETVDRGLDQRRSEASPALAGSHKRLHQRLPHRLHQRLHQRRSHLKHQPHHSRGIRGSRPRHRRKFRQGYPADLTGKPAPDLRWRSPACGRTASACWPVGARLALSAVGDHLPPARRPPAPSRRTLRSPGEPRRVRCAHPPPLSAGLPAGTLVLIGTRRMPCFQPVPRRGNGNGPPTAHRHTVCATHAWLISRPETVLCIRLVRLPYLFALGERSTGPPSPPRSGTDLSPAASSSDSGFGRRRRRRRDPGACSSR